MRPFRKFFLMIAAPLVLVPASSSLAARSTSSGPVKELQQSEKIIKAVMSAPDKGIPIELLQSASCIGVFPDVKKGGEFGSGLFSCRQQDGTMGAPAFFTIGGSSFKWDGKAADLIFLIMSDEGVDHLLRDHFTIGADVPAAAGPVGRNVDGTTETQKKAQMLAWSRSGNALLGASLEGSIIRPNMKEIQLLYRKSVSPKGILLDRSMTIPAEARSFVRTLTELAKKP